MRRSTQTLLLASLTTLLLCGCTKSRNFERTGIMEQIPESTAHEEPIAGAPADYSLWAGPNGLMDDDEFEEAFEALEVYATWDEDDDGTVDRAEFVDEVTRIWSAERDELTPDELRSLAAKWGGDDAALRAEQWDDDGNGGITEDEMLRVVKSLNLYEQWDRDGDGQFERGELKRLAFIMWDEDDSGFVEKSEWDRTENRWLTSPPIARR